jgi:hypothetical protein
MRSRPWLVVLGFLIAGAWPALALACAMCGGGGDSPRSQAAFFDTTIILSLLPLGMIGGGVWWLKREGRGELRREFEVRHSFPPESEPTRESGDEPRDEPRA